MITKEELLNDFVSNGYKAKIGKSVIGLIPTGSKPRFFTVIDSDGVEKILETASYAFEYFCHINEASIKLISKEEANIPEYKEAMNILIDEEQKIRICKSVIYELPGGFIVKDCFGKNRLFDSDQSRWAYNYFCFVNGVEQ